MVEAPRAEYRLCEIPPVAGMAKSSCEYARNAQAGGEAEGRAAARKAVIEASGAGGGTYGHRRVHAQVNADAGGRRGDRRADGPRHHEGRGPGRLRRQEEAALQLVRGRDLRGADQPLAR